MKWAIGLDLRSEGHGALAFGKWLRERSDDDAFTALHVLETSPVLAALRDREDRIDAVELTREAGQQELDAAGLHGIEGPILLEGSVPDDALAHEIKAIGADALVIGRRAESKDSRFARLGPVARRLLKALPMPIVVAPPDLRTASIGEGPILLATDLHDDSLAAARFARRVADEHGRELVTVHVLTGYDSAAMFVPAATLQQLYEQLGLDRRKDLDGWNREAGLGPIPSIVATGDVVDRVVGIAEKERAPLVVTGSRRLSTVARIFTASIGTTLAAHATCAVAVVPPNAE